MCFLTFHPYGLPLAPPCRDSLPTPRPPERFVYNQKRQGFASLFAYYKIYGKRNSPKVSFDVVFLTKKYSSRLITNYHYDAIYHESALTIPNILSLTNHP